jgi:hypothetical protein
MTREEMQRYLDEKMGVEEESPGVKRERNGMTLSLGFMSKRAAIAHLIRLQREELERGGK